MATLLPSRDDGREDAQLRPMSTEQGLINQADGSVRFEQGGKDGTSVLVSVQGPVEQMGARGTRGAIEVVCKPASGKTGPVDIERGCAIQAALEAVTMLSLIPRTVITVVVETVHDDGGLLAAAINGACLAFLDAGVAMRGLVTATACALAGPGRIILDPTAAEEKAASAVVTTAWLSNQPGVVTCVTSGIQTEAEYLAAVDAGQAGAKSTLAFLRMAYEHKALKDHKVVPLAGATEGEGSGGGRGPGGGGESKES